MLAWVAAGGTDAAQPVASLLETAPVTIAPAASVADAVLAMSAANVDAIAMTADGTLSTAVEAIVTARDLAPAFGDQPAAFARDIRRASTIEELASLTRRSRAIALEYLTGASAVDWITRFVHLGDVAIVKKLVELTGGGDIGGCWCFHGSAGREELLTTLAPKVAIIVAEGVDTAAAQAALHRVVEGLSACGYLPRLDMPFEPAFYAASVGEWQTATGIGSAIRFASRPIARGRCWICDRSSAEQSLWNDVDAAVVEAVDRDFVQVLANDCMANLPPLTFFEDAVVDSVGEQQATFRLEQNALRPLVDVGRVFGLAAKTAMGRSTLERFTTARRLLPEHEAVFREAADTLRIVLWQQGRVGISRGTNGSELPAALLSRSDRQVLKSGFRSILKLLELAANPLWLDRL